MKCPLGSMNVHSELHGYLPILIVIVYEWNIVLVAVIHNRSVGSSKSQFTLWGPWIFTLICKRLEDTKIIRNHPLGMCCCIVINQCYNLTPCSMLLREIEMEQVSWVKWKGRKYRKWITGGGEGEKGVCFQQGGMSGDDVGTDSSQQKKHGPVTRGNSRRPQSWGTSSGLKCGRTRRGGRE